MAAPKEKSMTSDLPADIWLLRPCELYLEEFYDCSSFRGRFHQHYVNGSFTNCKPWKADYNNCLKFRYTGDPTHLEPVISNEKERREARLQSARANTVWEYRETPPEDWNSPLPDWTKAREESLLARAQTTKDSNSTMFQPESESSSKCVIS